MTQVAIGDPISSANNTFLDDEDESHKCRRCNLSISEGHAYELGGDRWHMYCFSCSKCSKLLGTSSNFLVLGTGDLICSDCSYACNACGKKIDDLAILTGDQAYCSSCFCCRNCKKRIEDLRYARTSKGLFCMNCHEKLLEKKKRHEHDKKFKDRSSSLGLSSSNRSSIRSSKYANMEKSLPKVPPTNSNPPQSNTNTTNTPSSSHNVSIASDEAYSEISTPDVLDVPSSIARTSAVPPRSPKRKQVPLSQEAQPQQEPFTFQDQNQTPVSTLDPPITVKSTSSPIRMRSPSIPDQSYFEGHDSVSKSISETTPSQQIDSPPTSLHNTPDLNNAFNNHTTPKKSQFLTEGTPLKQAIISPNGKNRQAVVLESLSSSSSNNILSSYINESPPPKIPPPELPEVGGDDFIDMNDSSDDDQISKYNQTTQGFQESRQSDRVPSGLNIQNVPQLNSTNDGYDDDDIRSSEDFQSFQSTIQHSFDDPEARKDQSQPQQYQAPNTPRSWKFGLGSSRNDNSNNVVGGSTLLSPTSPSPMNHSKKSALTNITNESGSSVGRTKSIKSPKAFLSFRKHKKSASGSSLEPTFENPNNQKGKYHSPLIEPSSRFDSNLQTPKFGSHSRGKSDSSPYQGAALFTTPPVPENRHHHTHSHSNSQINFNNSISRSNTAHYRSASDANAYSKNHHDSNELTGFELELRSLKTEIFDLKQAKSGLRLEVNDLTNQRDQLNVEVLQLNSKMEKLKVEFDEHQKQYEEQQRQFQELYQQQEQFNQQHQQQQPLQSQPIQKSVSQNDAQLNSEKSNGDAPIVTVLSPPQEQINEVQQPKTKGRFWRRNNVTKGIGNVFNKSDTMSSSQSSYSLSHLLAAENKSGNSVGHNNNNNNNNNSGNNRGGNPTISAPLLRNEELDELGGNDNKKLINGSKSNNYIEIGTSSSNSTKSNISNSGLIMSDLFNSTLEMRTLFEKRSIPLLITRLISEVESRGLDSEGIYRKNGGTLQMNNILKAFNNLLTAETSQELENSLEGDINAVTSSLKKYLYHHLPEPIISMNSYDSFIQVASIEKPIEKIEQLSKILNQLPKANVKTLSYLLVHIKKIESFSNVNKMTYHNLAVVFAPTFTRVSSGERELADMQPRNTVTEFLLINQDEILKNVDY
ncbi:Zinc finger protein [Wickerhamomyces ciferrii]|uniref:Zinc finger protein n=1 Tax=Wickerhamomyces ciferrii (strain ATCC 14091 / BCRC 22168 / CBS 111 / JCM 3599 / NBRC 0793 / NRRL Y-1031 F-60-10) TaxID=1206466 RepID=K0KPG7_WICCF|nr:Zinc finger protein [Wickerhamomyces ciferrii]CCH43043.1 Zinc finger protein [Wickerhamomyces ciferrii]